MGAAVAAGAQVRSVGAEQEHRGEGEDADRHDQQDRRRPERAIGPWPGAHRHVAHARQVPGSTRSA
jgi:hypothetical protein